MVQIFSQYVSAKSFLLMLLEASLIVLSLLCAVRLRFWSDPENIAAYMLYPDFAIQCGMVLVVCLTCFYYNGLYDANTGFSAMQRVLRIEQAIGAASLILGLLYYMMPALVLSRGVFLIAMLLAAVFVFLGRKLLDSAWQLTAPVQHVVILGTGQVALDLAREITLRNDLSIRLDGFVAGFSGEQVGTTLAGVPVLGNTTDMERIARERAVSRIIVALEDRRGVLPTRDLVSLRVRGVYVEEAGSALSALTGRVSLRAIKPSWFVFSEGFRRSRLQEAIKRVFDLVFATVGLILSLPIMLAVAAAVRLESRGPVIYRQVRVGRMNRNFDVLKFRSMVENAEGANGAQWAAENDPRVTRIGQFLRKYRLDELPQFFNVIRGEMSFVGPRPERPCFVDELRQTIPYYDERHSVRPGITGWAQVRYRYGATVEDSFNKLEYDLFYLKNMSLAFDTAIIFATIRIVMGGMGAR
jgi:sugar transferase (PEP-CTERM system associated)